MVDGKIGGEIVMDIENLTKIAIFQILFEFSQSDWEDRSYDESQYIGFFYPDYRKSLH